MRRPTSSYRCFKVYRVEALMDMADVLRGSEDMLPAKFSAAEKFSDCIISEVAICAVLTAHAVAGKSSHFLQYKSRVYSG